MKKHLGLLMMLALPATGIIAENINKQFSTAGFFAVQNSPREVYNFNPGWRFYKGAVEGAQLMNFDDSEWEAANLPHGLEIHGENASGCRNYQGEAWYRKNFKLNKKTGRTVIFFEAAMGKSQVWVNGKLLLEHFGGFLPFAVDITDVAVYDGKDNIVAVKVDNSDDPTYPPGTKQASLDFSYLGGIYRDTYLINTSDVHVTLPQISKQVAGGGVFVATDKAHDNKASLSIKTEVTNQSNRAQSITVKTTLENLDYKALKTIEKKITLSSGKSKHIEQDLKVDNVKLWSPDEPNLNYVKTEVWANGVMVDCMRTRVGIRQVEMLGEKGMYINQKPFDKKLIGANRHQDYAYVGNALPNSGQWRDVKLLKDGGCNVIRVAHYPMDDAFYDACDELGIVTTSANPGWHFFNKTNPIFEERMYDDTRRLVQKDRNRPSIFMWETALNETPQQPDRVLANMHKIAHEEYPYKGFFTVTDMHEALKGGMDLHYHGTDPKVNSFTRECGDGNEVDNWYSHNAVTRIKSEWGERALIGQAENLAVTLGSLNSTAKTRLGGALWAGIEHQRGYHPDPFWGGLLNVFRMPKYSYFLFQSQTAKEPMIYITHELTQASNPDIIIYSNCDEIKLSYNGKDLGSQIPATQGNYKGLPHAPFVFKDVFKLLDIKQAGRNNKFVAELIADGYKNGKLVITEKKLYPLRSEALRLDIDGQGIALEADGSDFIPLRATVIDANGTKKVLASELVYFKIEGEGEIIGDEYTGANPMKTQMGVATALVKATTKPGKIKVTAYSPGLTPATIEFSSIRSALPMSYDQSYMATSKQNKENMLIFTNTVQEKGSTEAGDLLKRISELEMELVGKDQEIMELRSTQNQN